MPPLKRISKEDIVNAAYDILREDGMEAINARRVGRVLGCSVQPIFSNFENMEDLKNAVVEKCVKFAYEFMSSGIKNDDLPFKRIGLNYINLAKTEPNIYKMLFVGNGHMKMNEFFNRCGIYMGFEEQMAFHAASSESHEEELGMFQLMLVFATGIGFLTANGTVDFTDEEVSEMLKREFLALVEIEKIKAAGVDIKKINKTPLN